MAAQYLTLNYPYLWFVGLEHYWGRDAMILVYHLETGNRFTFLIPYN